MKVFRVVAGIAMFICLLPIFSVVAAGTIASWNGCTLHEGFVNPCVVFGRDIGQVLYGLAVSGWLGMVTLPFFSIIAMFWLIIEIARWALMRSRRNRAAD